MPLPTFSGTVIECWPNSAFIIQEYYYDSSSIFSWYQPRNNGFIHHINRAEQDSSGNFISSSGGAWPLLDGAAHPLKEQAST